MGLFNSSSKGNWQYRGEDYCDYCKERTSHESRDCGYYPSESNCKIHEYRCKKCGCIHKSEEYEDYER